MELNEYCLLNELIYCIYTEKNFEALCRILLKRLKHFIKCSYASVLLADLKNEGHLCHPICEPESFIEAEKRYLQYEEQDHLLWMSYSPQTMVFRDSQALSDSKRLSSRIYRDCYSHYDIFDTLQMNLTYNSHFLGCVTLYRTKHEPQFTDLDVLYLRLLSIHLNGVFYQRYYLASSPEFQNDVSTEKHNSPSGGQTQIHSLLTKREHEIADHVQKGRSNAEIAETLNITEHTLNKHLQNIYRKLNISSRWELLSYLNYISKQ
ncbi:helix-turn-helix transcriptional regulator [Clostridium transplantifaecale]|uniref:helix-turn-helix transcriptional regulator n=1 Tax=Clostridium transplantifaecale TaxID=2479838 RepID=UPI000F6359A9|nr:LuxR family transcriptional regulator [Clostridium transplantifaecale]